MFIKPVASPPGNKAQHEIGKRRKLQAEDLQAERAKPTKDRRTERIDRSLGTSKEIQPSLDKSIAAMFTPNPVNVSHNSDASVEAAIRMNQMKA